MLDSGLRHIGSFDHAMQIGNQTIEWEMSAP